MSNHQFIIPDEVVVSRIYLFRGKRVMLDSDLAELYGTETKRINEQVKRNSDRFPEDFMFQLNQHEWNHLKSQNATSSWGGRRVLPYVFTEHGVLMLSSVLSSRKAIQVNIQIMRIFTRMREVILSNQELRLEVERVWYAIVDQDDRIDALSEYLRKFIEVEPKPRNKIGYRQKNG